MDWEKDKLISIIKKYARINRDKIKLDSNLVSDLGLDSISIMAIILNTEKRFHIELTGEDFKDYIINTPQDILNVIEKKRL